jgi:DNA-binding NarL/FixJ family response regulator
MKPKNPAPPLRAALIEDDNSLRKLLSDTLAEAGGIEICGRFADAESAVERLPGLGPDVALVDICLPGMDGVECVRRLKPKLPRTQFMMLTVYEDTQRIFTALAAGATGYLLKRASPEDLVRAVREIHQGGSPISSNIARKLVESFQPGVKTGDDIRLAPREREILALLAQGYSYKEIADKLDLSVRTVGAHIRSTYEKLHVHSRSQAVAKFLGV